MLAEVTGSASFGMSDFKKLRVWRKLEYHFIVARDVRAITAADFSSTLSQLIDVRKMLHGLMSKLSSPKRTVPSS